MKRMITQELINKVNDLLNNISSGVFSPNKISLDSVADLEISDLGALFPTAENGKFLAWNNGVLANADGGTKLYKHHIALIDGSNDKIELIDDNATPITISTLYDRCNSSLNAFCSFEDSGVEGILGKALRIDVDETNKITFFMISENGNIVSDNLTASIFVDTITQL